MVEQCSDRTLTPLTFTPLNRERNGVALMRNFIVRVLLVKNGNGNEPLAKSEGEERREKKEELLLLATR